LAHCLVKRLYGRTNKHDDATKQIGRHVRRLERAQRATDQNNISDDLNEGNMVQDVHYQISKSRNDPLNIYCYVRANEGDPAFIVRCVFEHHFVCWLN